MSEWLLIRFPGAAVSDAADDSIEWMVVDAAGHLVAPPAAGSLAEAAMQAPGKRIAVVVPGADVLSVEVDLPPRASGPRLLQAVPFAIEEQVADDVETLHFALGSRSDSGRTQVSVVTRVLMDLWMQRLAAAGLAPQGLFADSALLPAAASGAVALLEHDEICLRVGDQPVLRLPCSPFADVVEMALPLDADGQLPALTVFATPAAWEAVASEIEACRDRFAAFRVQLLPNGALPLLALRAVAPERDAAAPTNLLQGVHAPRPSGMGDFRPWRLAAGLAAAWLLLFGASQAWQFRKLRAAETALDGAIAAVVNATFPGQPVPPDARARFEQQLLLARSGSARNGAMLPVLAALAQAAGSSPDASLESVRIDTSAADVRIKAPNAESLERISSALRGSGWQADLQGGTASADAYEGSIRLQAGGGGST